MGDVDVSDQPRNSYWFDNWLRKRKWWWSIMFWYIGVILVNAYIVYRRVNLEAGMSKSDLLSQQNFRNNLRWHGLAPISTGLLVVHLSS